MSGLLRLLTVLSSVLGFVSAVPPSNNNVSLSGTAGVPTWCGKAYRPQDPAIEPGGRIGPPVLSERPLLDLKIRPRYSPYLASDEKGSFLVDMSLSDIHGKEYPCASILDQQSLNDATTQYNSTKTSGNQFLSVFISRVDRGDEIASINVGVNNTNIEISFPIEEFEPRLEPYKIEVRHISRCGSAYTATTQFLRLPDPPSGLSATRLDNLYQALNVQKDGQWVPLFPYSFYSGSGDSDPSKLAAFARQGYNVLHVIPPYDLDWFDKVVDEAEKVGLWIMYDMRHTYKDPDKVRTEVQRYKDKKNLLLWYTADEPDGQVDPTDAPKKSYDLIKQLDPYHPVSLCLNCANYFFEPYSAGADILMSDVYPIGANTTFSTQFKTVCNETYGCCGCDNCYGEDDINNIGSRLDQMKLFQTQLGQNQKPLWGVPQAFGSAEHWSRTPDDKEEAAMNMMSINHGAKGIVMWTWPTTAELAGVTSKLANTLTQDCAKWILGGKRLGPSSVIGGQGGVDVSAWMAGTEIMISVINTSRNAQRGTVKVQMPDGIKITSRGRTFWGDGSTWIIDGSQSSILRANTPALSVDVFSVKFSEGVVEPDNTLLAPIINRPS